MQWSVGSLFSGVGGFELGFEAAGFRVAWQVEIDRDAVSVLERHWPNVRRYGDVRDVDPAELESVDVVTFGSPCQDFSVAGKRAGLAGERSGLFGEAIRIIRGVRPAFAVWENVPGALSSTRGRDFGAVLDSLADIGALDIAWRVLDARFFGVPQRRRRIFLVADFRAERAGSVLFESASGTGNSQACGATGEGLAGDAEDGAGDPGRAVAAEGGNRTSGPIGVATACNAHGGPHGRQDFESETFLVASPITASARPAMMPGGRGDGADNLVVSDAVAVHEHQLGRVYENGHTHGLGGPGGKPGQGYQAVRDGLTVRRLTPTECERLMGWPDGHTERRADGSLIPDGPRYRMIGNGVVAPVARWIGERLRAVLEGAC